MFNIPVTSQDLRLYIKNLDRYPREDQKQILEKLAFDCYLRRGIVPPQLIALQKRAAGAKPGFKFNPYHDDLGRFTFAPGGEAGDDDENADSSDGSSSETDTDSDIGDMRLVQEEIPPSLPLDEEIPVTPKLPFDKFPVDQTQPPAPGFEWKGTGSPETGKGNWVNPNTGEKLFPDMDHGPPEGPHWDYKTPDGEWRLYPDGRIEPKIVVGGEIA